MRIANWAMNLMLSLVQTCTPAKPLGFGYIEMIKLVTKTKVLACAS